MNCKNLRIRSKNYKKYFYCIKNKCVVDGNTCYCCQNKEYKEIKPLKRAEIKPKKKTITKTKSIIQNVKEDYFTGEMENLEEHHIFFGTSNRKLSEKYGLKVWLTEENHRGSEGVHGIKGKEKNEELKRFAQMKFNEFYPDLDFVEIFGKNYI